MAASGYRYGDYSCAVSQADCSIVRAPADLVLAPEHEFSRPHFYIELVLKKTDFQESDNSILHHSEYWHWVLAPFDHLTEPVHKDSSVLFAMLSILYVPLNYRNHMWRHIRDKIGNSARVMAEDPCNAGIKLIPMSVHISIEDYVERSEEEDPEELDDVEIELQVGSKKGPASEASVAAPVSMCVPEDCYTCIICREQLEVGSEATCMPCDHFYHKDCTREWLARSNMCRFELD